MSYSKTPLDALIEIALFLIGRWLYSAANDDHQDDQAEANKTAAADQARAIFDPTHGDSADENILPQRHNRYD